jgi:hemerythrin superfamily protein
MTAVERPVSEDCGYSAGNANVSSLLEHDHRGIDALFSAVEGLISGRDRPAAAEALLTFQKRLDAHIAAEELVLFPAFEEATAFSGPTRVMRSEHGDFRRLMAEIRTALEGGSDRDPLPLVQELGRSLHGHNLKEERVLYPQMDANLRGPQLEELVTRIAFALG